jgi:alpha,alpha-trehalase
MLRISHSRAFNLMIIFFVIAFSSQKHFECHHPIYCTGELLKVFQKSHLFSDSKTFVDMPLLKQPEEILKDFENLPKHPSKDDLLDFIHKNFGQSGSDINAVDPIDWKPDPKLLSKLSNTKIIHWVDYLNKKWKSLIRTFKHEEKDQNRYSSIWVPNPFVVAGGRFREFYYWDSYFILEGLLLSEMHVTAKGMIENFFYLIDKYGIIPNGGRVYYMNRSQPPLLTLMVKLYYDETKDLEFLQMSFPYLEREYEFWIENRLVQLELDRETKTNLNHYKVDISNPRPESYVEDILTAHELDTDEERIRVYKGLVAAAESGWDFSSRWLKESHKLSSIDTENVVPVDLNSILYSVEITLSEIFSLCGKKMKKYYYKKNAKNRKKSMQKYLWNKNLTIWNDYLIKENSRNENLFTSNYLPLWADLVKLSEVEITTLLENLTPLLDYKGGTPTSLIFSGQQWDFPNAWSPMEYFLIKGLENLNSKKAHEIAKFLAHKWILNNYCTWEKTGHMYEKYDVNSVGSPGHGGEYEVQEGFGWTNGVALYLVDRYGQSLHLPKCE